MSRDTILRDEDGNRWSLDNLSTQKWLEGHAPGAKKVSEWLREKAVELFTRGEDKAAIEMRTLAEDVLTRLIPEFQKYAERHAQEFPSQLTEEDQ